MPARILVIEDNKENLDLIQYLLAAFGHSVLIARDGVEGLEVASRELPDLIISDLQMPRLDGYEVARSIRAHPVLAKRPLIAVTSFAMRGDQERVLAAGFDAYISKPIVPEEFVSQVEQYLAPTSPLVRATPPPTERPQMTPRSFHTTILAVDNSPANRSLIKSTLEPFGYQVILADSVRQALILARENPPGLILSDLHMPGQDGFDFFAALHQDPTLRLIPFAILSATFRHDLDIDEARRRGVEFFIQRPIEPMQLLSEVEECIAKGRRASA